MAAASPPDSPCLPFGAAARQATLIGSKMGRDLRTLNYETPDRNEMFAHVDILARTTAFSDGLRKLPYETLP